MRRGILRSSAGFTYIGALVIVVVMGIMAAQAVQVWKTTMRREREEELLFRGLQYMDALRRWYWPKGIPTGPTNANSVSQGSVSTAPPGTKPVYPSALPPGVPGPKELKDLLKGNGMAPKPCLRKLYLDPITGKDFAVHKGVDGRIDGVYSTSDAQPLKQGNFDGSPLSTAFQLNTADFENKSKYSEWQFICIHFPQEFGSGAAKIKGAVSVDELNKGSGGDIGNLPPPPAPAGQPAGRSGMPNP